MSLLLDKFEGKLVDELASIINQLDFILNSFNPSTNKLPYYFGINIWDLDIQRIRNTITKEEPRILILDIELKNNILLIKFQLKGEAYGFTKAF